MEGRNILSGLTRYLLLTLVCYLVITNLPANKLEKNESLLLSVTISLIFAILDIYGGVFKNLLNLICNCKK